MTVSSKIALALFLVAPALAPALDFQPAARFNGELSYSSLPPTATWGLVGNAFLLPAMHQGNWTLLPLFAALGQTSENSIEEDSFFVESYTFLDKPQLRYKRGDLTYRVWGDAKHAFNKQTSGEVWSEGLYDYEEYGVGLGAEWKLLPMTLSAGLEDLHRTYPNYHELGTVVVNGKDYYSKDYDGWKLTLGATADKEARLPWSLNYTLLFRNYTDSYRIQGTGPGDQIGVLDLTTLRHDMLNHVEAAMQGALSQHFAWGTTAGFDWNISNEGFFDVTQPADFNADFYGYISEILGLSLTWLPGAADGPSLTPSYLLTNFNYTGRLIRQPDGTFTQGVEEDIQHRLGLDGRWPLRPWVALTGGVSYTSVQSNQEFISSLRNSYELFKANLGLDMSY